MLKSLLILLAVLLSAPGMVTGHDLWLEKETPQEPPSYTLRHGHPDSDTSHKAAGMAGFGHGLNSDSLDSLSILRAVCIDSSGLATEITLEDSRSLSFRCGGAALIVAVSTGFWTKTPYGTKNVPRTGVQRPVRSWQSLESVKRIDGWVPALALPISSGLELMPQSNPLVLAEGEKLRLLVTFDGKPAAGAVVSCDGRPRGTTGDDGRINIRIRRPGLQMIRADLTLPFPGPEADETVHTATLNFEVQAR